MMQKITGLFLFCLSFLTGNAQSGSRVSRAFAVVVGINEYQDDNFPSLKYAASDAKRFYAFLKNFYGLDTSNGNVKLLINENATRANILNQVSQLFNRSAEENNDVLIFYFSGHGTNSEVTNDGYLLTQDADNKALASTAISMNEIRNRLESSKSRIKLCFIDACHAGIFYKSGKGAKEDQTALVNERLENLSKGLPGSVIFLSSTERLESQEVDSLKSGRFTYYLLHGLEGDADKYAKSETGRNDGRVSVGEMMDYIYDEIYESSKYEQRPFVYASIEDSTALNIISHKPGLPEGIGRAKDAIIVRSTRPGSSDDARKSLTNMGVLWNGKNFLDL